MINPTDELIGNPDTDEEPTPAKETLEDLDVSEGQAEDAKGGVGCTHSGTP